LNGIKCFAYLLKQLLQFAGRAKCSYLAMNVLGTSRRLCGASKAGMADESGRQEFPLDLFIVSTFSLQIGFDELFLWAFIAALLDH
jgi:hypothetical protein